MEATTCELLWLSCCLADLKVPIKLPVTLFCDHKAAQQIALIHIFMREQNIWIFISTSQEIKSKKVS